MSGSLCTSRNSLLRVNGSERISESSNLAVCVVISVPKLYHLRCFLSQAKRGQSVGERLKGHEGSQALDGCISILITTVRDRQMTCALGNYEEQRIVSPCLEQKKLRGAGCRCLIIDPRQFLGVGGRL